MPQYDSRTVRLAVAVTAALVAILLRLATDPVFGGRSPWLWFILAVAMSAWFGGLKPGMVTTALVLTLGVYFENGRENPAPYGYSMLLFLFISFVICVAMQRLRMERFNAQIAGNRLHEVLESTQDAVLSVDSEFRCLYANARAGQIAKRQPALLHGKSLRTIFPETPASGIYRELQRAFREKTFVRFEGRVEGTVEGLARWYEFDAYPMLNGLNLFVRDITAKRAADLERAAIAKALENEHLRLETVIREMPVGVIIASSEMRIELINQTASVLFGSDIQPGYDLSKARRGELKTAGGLSIEPNDSPMRHTIRTGERVVNLEAEYTRPDGVSMMLILNSLPLAGPDGRLRGAMCTYADVTSLRRMQDALAGSEARLRSLFDSPIIGIISGNEDSIIEANDAFLCMLGYSREELENGEMMRIGVTAPEFLHLDQKAVRQLSQHGFARPFEKEFVAKDGRRVPVLLGSASYEKNHWSPWIAWVLDRSEHRIMESRLREAAKLESIGLLAGGIAHDFNNILTSILGNSSLAYEKLPPEHRARGLIESAIHSTERAADLTRQLLAYAGKGPFLVRPVDLSKLTAEIGQLIRTSIPRNVELVLQLAPDLPLVDGDATQLHQLIMNLAINAAEAVGEGNGTVSVIVGVTEVSARVPLSASLETDLTPGEYVSIEVRDDGSGMDSETLQRIFDPFFTTKFTGRGLGLAAATGIVRAHKGAIQVESAPGNGSVFRVLLPVSRTRSIQLQSSSPDAIPGAGTVLVVDDEEIVRSVAKAALERYGYTVLLASDGREALDIYRGLSYGVSMVVLDLIMPKMGGAEALTNLMAINPDVRVLLTSGFDATETVPRFAGKGMAGFIQKPFTAGALAAKVREILGH